MERALQRLSNLPKISIIIVNLNGKKWLEICLPSIFRSKYPKDKMEIILVDNGSIDNSVEYFLQQVRKYGLSHIVIRNKHNMGWSPANNQGAKVASGDFLIFLSNDIELEPNALREIVNTFLKHKDIGVIQFNSLSMWDKKTTDSAMNFLDIYGFAYGYVPQDKLYTVTFAEGMAFAIRKDIFFQVGMFDDYYFMEYDDMDLSLRVWLTGYKVVFHPRAIVYHARGGTVGRDYFTKKLNNIKNYTRNHIVTLLKIWPWKMLVYVLPMVIIIQLIKTLVISFIFKKSQLSKAVILGLFEAIRDSYKIIKYKRKKVQEIKIISDNDFKQIFHPFKPALQYIFLKKQHAGRRFYINARPPYKLPS